MTVATFTEPAAPVGLGVWAAELRAAAEIAGSLALTAFVPASLRVTSNGRPDGPLDEAATSATITAALLTGREVGLSPMAAMRSIDVIQGTPAMRAHTMRALVLARGHEVWMVEATNTRCVYRGQRKTSPHVQEFTFTMDDARHVGIANRPQWRAQPRTMLIARATAGICRLVAPEALLGLPYVVEELGDDDLEDGDAATPDTAPRKRTARRAVRPVVEAQLPPTPDTPAPDLKPAPTADNPEPVPGVTPQQLRALHTAMTVAGIVERMDRLAYVSSVIGRDVDTSNDLTRDEASAVLDALAELTLATDDDDAPPVDDDPPPEEPEP
jgi:hypothetical protein